MKRSAFLSSLLLSLLVLTCVSEAKKIVQVEVVASHAAAHDQDDLSQILKALSTPEGTASPAEAFHLDVIINNNHVTLLCRDKKGCENLKPGKYEAVAFGRKNTELVLNLPSSPKPIKRRYEITGSW